MSRTPTKLQPLRASPLPLVTSPGKSSLSTALLSPLDSLSLRGLRRDVLEMQLFIDQLLRRAPPSSASQKLEAELLQLGSEAVDVQLAALLRLLRERVATVAELCGVPSCRSQYAPLEPVVGDLLLVSKALVDLQQEVASAGLALPGGAWNTGSLVSLVAESNSGTGLNAGEAATGSQPPLAKLQLQQQQAAKERLIEKAKSKVEERSSRAHVMRDASQPTPSVGALPTPRERSMNASQNSNVSPHFSAAHSATVRVPSSLAADLRDLLHEDVSSEAEVHRVMQWIVTLAQRLKHCGANGEASPSLERSASDVAAVKEQQLRSRISALSDDIRARDEEIARLRHQVEDSRFSPNRAKTITCVNDAPMSFEVEKQYLRAAYRSQMRIQELEEAYQKLFADGATDRQRASDLQNEVGALRATVSDLQKQCAALKASCDEQVEMCEGISKTRKEEAQMCSAAVSQLEGRVTSLNGELTSVREAMALLQGNFETLFDDWCVSQQRIEIARVEKDVLRSEYDIYQQCYHPQQVEQLEMTQGQLLSVWTSADENEAQKTVLRQQLDDAQATIRILHEESKALVDRVKASTEFKLLTVKAPEETKQLVARWQAMQSDREKREAAALKTQGDRVEVYRKRAAAEVASRKTQHYADVVPVNAAEIASTFARQKEWSQSRMPSTNAEEESNVRIPKDVRVAFVQESSKRLVHFTEFWAELFPGEEL